MGSVDMAAAKRVDLAVSIPIKYEEMFDLLFGLYVFERFRSVYVWKLRNDSLGLDLIM